MNADEVIRWLQDQEQRAGTFARPHWRNAAKEVGYAKHMEVEDNVGGGTVTPINRARFPRERDEGEAS